MIEILSTPPLNAMQDLGRPGYRDIGLCQGGAMDDLALRIANLIVGNDAGAAAIEVQNFPLRLRATADHLMGITGADAPVSFAGVAVPSWWGMLLRSDQELIVGRPRRGARIYITVGGGFRVDCVLGSRSTDLRNGFGGFKDRDLRSGDVLDTGDPTPCDPRLARDGFGLEPPASELSFAEAQGHDELAIRVLPGPEHDEFDAESRNAFWDGPWTVTPMSDRMGMRLAGGRPLMRPNTRELRSGGILPGVIQVPPSGDPLIQLRDANSAGGYPRIGVVAQADMWRLAQAPAQARLKFITVGREEAVEAKGRKAAYLYLATRTLSPFFARRPGATSSEMLHA